jgi:electron transport complex protein RnfG
MKTRAALRAGATLGLIGALCAALVAATYHSTRDRIAANNKALLEKSLEPALAGVFYDGSVSESRLVIEPPHELPGRAPAVVYRVYSGQDPVAALIIVTARDGYSGPIRILIGIEADGEVTGLRILEHRETPGLGDKIELARSDWVRQFEGRSLQDPAPARWAIRADGGDFDQLTGASVTPRAIIKAMRDTLLYFETHREDIFSLPATEESQ